MAPVNNNRQGPGGGGNRPGGRFGNSPGGPRFGGNNRRRGPGGPSRGSGRRGDENDDDLKDKVIFINRSSKVVKGGRRFNFSALVVVGDRKGVVGLGLGKANEVAEAIRKANINARNATQKVSLGLNTIPHEIYSSFDGARILLRPASEGTGVIAGKTVRAVLESAGVKNVLTKSLGSKNPANVAKATLKALKQLRLRNDVLKLRGLQVDKPEKEKSEASETE
ncbi:MAG TPA: 30S ribosomal protein S5 [Verrucomicrobiales bacterium]|nr:30S ribosomal protein S5 [Verrucomicrobiales bacterium]